MSKIKSALELALEKTADLKIDKEALKRSEIEKQGRIAAGLFLSREDKELKKALEKVSKEERAWFRDAAKESLNANITLPMGEQDLNKLDLLLEGYIELGIKKKEGAHIFDQTRQLFLQYLKDQENLVEMVRNSYEPQLRQKEAQYRKQTGQNVTLTAEQDPEFLKILDEQAAGLQNQYKEVVKQIKQELDKLL